MATVTIEDNPKETDTVVFDLPTPDADGCFLTDPYRVDSVIIYYVERNFSNPNSKQYDVVNYQTTKLAAAEAAERLACASPTDGNIAEAKRFRAEADSESTTTPFFYNEARPIKMIGNGVFPAWFSTDPDNAHIEQVTEDDDGDPVYGMFQYSWDTTGMREGDYFICWTWTPLPASDRISQHVKFNLGGNTVVTTSIPSHYTNPDKYEKLLELYLPEMFKMKMTDDDRTPDVLDKFNKAVAGGFTVLEDLGNQISDLLDANSTHEHFLPLLANFFDLKLKTNDPTLWRRQIKNAVPLFKKKGTKKGLESALAQAGITMSKLTKLWQVISPYTWIESFVYDDTNSWELSKVALSLDLDNFSLALRPFDEDEYITLSSDYVSFATVDGVTTLTWVGNTISVDAIDLVKGDTLKVMYLYKIVPGTVEQTIENYIRSLPTADQRDERDQDYPLKNWNVKVIEEDDPLFGVIITDRHPFQDDLVFGQVRTEFAYSENAYNKDEFNGSIRNSKLPCDIDKNFIDPCSSCLGSKFNIDLEIENLSDDRILEARDVIREFVPFNAVLHTMNFTGGINEFIQPPVEEYEILINIRGEEFVIAGEGQMWFNRAMKKGTTTAKITRSGVTDSTLVVSDTGTVYNDGITIFSPDVRFDRIGMSQDGSALLEILAPSPNSGQTTLSNTNKHTASVAAATEPLNTSAFTFRVSNTLTTGTLCDVYQDDLYSLFDDQTDFTVFGVKSTWDVDHNGASGAWTVTIAAYSATPYNIINVLPDGILILEDDGSLPVSNVDGISYVLKNDTGTTIHTSTTGNVALKNRGRVQVDPSLTDVRNLIRGKCYVLIGAIQYEVAGFVSGEDDQLYIAAYDLGDTAGTNFKLYQRIVDNQIGYLSYQGLKLRVAGDLETSLGIQNGHRNLTALNDRVENDGFKENFLVAIEGQNYFITDIDGDSPSGFTTITLNGPAVYWQTWAAGGTSMPFSITQYTKQELTIPGQQFDLEAHTFRTYDRQGREVIDRTIEETSEVSMLSDEVSMLSVPIDNVVETVSQSEGVTFNIEWADNSHESGIII